jgi:pyruvate/2-oxoglutarate dehydrogenase complex dihydrolipoamide acyltransferase (E2) component
MEISDESLRHLAVQKSEVSNQSSDQATGSGAPSSALRPLIWTPRALKLAQEAGLEPAKIADIEATGPGGRVSGDDVAKYLASRK